jgi:hypothetical protein
MAIWVLTEEYNDYNQHGEYFIHVWNSKPTASQLAQYICGDGYDEENEYVVEHVNHVLGGGGRRNYEDQWYNLHVVK